MKNSDKIAQDRYLAGSGLAPINSPPLPIPDPVFSQEPGTFAHHTVTVRLPGLARLVLAENEFEPEVKRGLEALIAEIPHSAIRPLDDPEAPDAATWRRFLAPHLGQNWLETPWYFIEAYFFRRILAATGYFQRGQGQGKDPYLYEKRKGLEAGREAIGTLVRRVDAWGQSGIWDGEAFGHLLSADLWGNQADLSMWPVDEAERPSHHSAEQARAHLLVDDTGAIIEALVRRGVCAPLQDFPASSPASVRVSGEKEGFRRVDILVDNAGLELVGDLCLADYLLRVQAVAEVNLHLKAYPVYVSDATLPDVLETLAFLAVDASAEARSLAARLEQAFHQGRLRLRPDFFWCSPQAAWEMPGHLYGDIAGAALFISKGDANYRRLVGDRRWPFTTPFEEVTRYFPAPLAALRTFKSEVAVGLLPGQIETARRTDPDWMTDGRWGLIQFASNLTFYNRKKE